MKKKISKHFAKI